MVDSPSCWNTIPSKTIKSITSIFLYKSQSTNKLFWHIDLSQRHSFMPNCNSDTLICRKDTLIFHRNNGTCHKHPLKFHRYIFTHTRNTDVSERHFDMCQWQYVILHMDMSQIYFEMRHLDLELTSGAPDLLTSSHSHN